MKKKKMKKKKSENELLLLEDAARMAQCRCVMELLLSKLQMIHTELSLEMNRDIIIRTCGRVKSVESVRAKLVKKGFELTYENAVERINDLVGVRAVCSFEDDLQRVADMLLAHKDVKLLKKKDYLKEPKNSGYRSLHLIIQVPICFQGGVCWMKAEVQLRTTAMDFWAGLDHKLRYKKGQREADLIGAELKEYAAILAGVDGKMVELRDRIAAVG